MALIPSALKRLFPTVVRDAARYCANSGYRGMVRHQWSRERLRRRIEKVRPLLWEQLGGIVAGGPFQGLRYIRESVGSAWAPKMLGTYEKELWPVVDVLIRRRPRWIVDVGAAEGYYAVGLAMRLGAAQVVAFEADEGSHPSPAEVGRAQWCGRSHHGQGVLHQPNAPLRRLTHTVSCHHLRRGRGRV